MGPQSQKREASETCEQKAKGTRMIKLGGKKAERLDDNLQVNKGLFIKGSLPYLRTYHGSRFPVVYNPIY